MTKRSSLKAQARAWSLASGKKYTAALADVVAGTAFTGRSSSSPHGLRQEQDSLPLGPALALLPLLAPWEGPGSSPTQVPLGRGPAEELLWDVKVDPHILIAGGAGSGKSVAQRAILGHCLGHPDDWRVLAIDLKKVELPRYRSRSDVVLGVATSLEDALTMVRSLHATMMERYALMEEEGVHRAEDLSSPPHRILFMVDEVGEVFSLGGVKTEEGRRADAMKGELLLLVGDLLRLGRAAGIHVVIATQRPDSFTLPPTMKALLSARLLMGRALPTARLLTLDAHEDLEVDGVRGRGLFRSGSTQQAVIPFQVYWEVEEKVLRTLPSGAHPSA